MDSSTVRNITALAPETLANILRFLPGRSLVNALLVCRSWKNLAIREMHQRKHFVSKMFECCDPNPQSMIEEFLEDILVFLNNIDIVPSAMVISCSESFDHMPMPQFRKKFISKIMTNLPKGCVVLGAREVGAIIGDTGDLVEECEFSERLSVLFIPKVKGVNVNLLHMTIKEINGNEQQWRTKLDYLVDKDIKFLFLIGGSTIGKYIYDIWPNTIKILGEQVVITGSMAKPFAVVNNKATSSVVMGLAIGGNVEAGSVICDNKEHFHDEADIREILEGMPMLNQPCELRSTACFFTPCVVIPDHCIAEATSQLKKNYQDMKVFGFSGFGEIGLHSCPKHIDDFYSKFRILMHSYNIAFSILKLL